MEFYRDDNSFENLIQKVCLNEKIAEFLNKEGKEGDVILTIGAGDIYKVAENIVKRKT